MADLANYLYEWMDANYLDRAILLCNSFGYQIIAEFALRYCDRIARVILQAPSCVSGSLLRSPNSIIINNFLAKAQE